MSIFNSASSSASTEPDTSPLMIRLSCCTSPAANARSRSSSEIRRRVGGQLSVALTGLPPVGDLPRDPVFVDDQERVARAGYRGQAEDLDRTGWTRGVNRLTVLVEHRSHSAERVACHHRVADVQRAALHEQRWPPGRARGPAGPR